MGMSLMVGRSGLSLVLVALVAVLLGACEDAPQMGMRLEGDRVAGAEITLFLTGPGGNPATRARVTVNGEAATPDDEGRVVISVPVDATVLVIEAAQGQAEGRLEIAILPAPPGPQMGMRLEGDPIAGAEITLFLTGPGGNPATRARVTVNGEAATPDDEGRVVISVPVDATVLVIEAAQGQAEGRLEIAILPAPGA